MASVRNAAFAYDCRSSERGPRSSLAASHSTRPTFGRSLRTPWSCLLFWEANTIAKNLRLPRSGTAGASPAPEQAESTARFWRLSQDLVRACLPYEMVDVVWLVCGTIFCRSLQSHCDSQRLSRVPRLLSTRAGPECIAHALLRPILTSAPLSFPLMAFELSTSFCRRRRGGPSSRSSIPRERTPRASPLCAVQSKLHGDERLIAFFDDVYVASSPERTCEIHGSLRYDLRAQGHIQIRVSMTQTAEERGIWVLGTPLGYRAYVESQLHHTADNCQKLLDRIPLLQDFQSA